MKDFSCWCIILGIVVLLIIHLVLKEYGILEGLSGEHVDNYLRYVNMNMAKFQGKKKIQSLS